MELQLSRILLFDSGIGGLSIHKELNALLPDCEYHYYADHDAAPYGDKNDTWLNERINTLVSNLNDKLSPDIIVIACNTASTLSLNTLRSKITTNIIGVVPAIKTAAGKTGSHPIGLLATPATINRVYTNTLIRDHANDKRIIKVGTTELVHMAENKLAGIAPSLNKLKQVIAPFITYKCKHVVLGCTHFPLLIDELQLIAPNITWIDSGVAIAKRAETLLKSNLNFYPDPKSTFYSTSSIHPELENYICKIGFKSIALNHHNQ